MQQRAGEGYTIVSVALRTPMCDSRRSLPDLTDAGSTVAGPSEAERVDEDPVTVAIIVSAGNPAAPEATVSLLPISDAHSPAERDETATAGIPRGRGTRRERTADAVPGIGFAAEGRGPCTIHRGTATGSGRLDTRRAPDDRCRCGGIAGEYRCDRRRESRRNRRTDTPYHSRDGVVAM